MGRHNLARMTSATVGTGSITLASAVPGFLTFAQSGVVDGEKVTYGVQDSGAGEVGIGTYSSGVLTRDVVLASTASGAKITLTGNAQVYITLAAEEMTRAVAGADSVMASARGAL